MAIRAPQELSLLALLEGAKEQDNCKKLARRTAHISASHFNINAYSELECVTTFRFRKEHIGAISIVLSWQECLTKRNGYTCDRITATCIVLRRLASPVRLYDMEVEFGKHSSQLSEIFWDVVENFVDVRGALLSLRPNILRRRAHLYAQGIVDADGPLDRCVGFLDCTKVRISRPGGPNVNQRSCYSGHKRMHCLIYQTLTTPDGLIFALHGPVEGRRHDLTLLRQSGWEGQLSDILQVNGDQFYVYADSAYMLRPYMIVPYCAMGASVEQMAFNAAMSSVRVAVEWNYKDLKQVWATNDYARLLKVRKAPVAILYKASALLLNMRTCLYKGGQVGSYFAVEAPSWHEYLTSD